VYDEKLKLRIRTHSPKLISFICSPLRTIITHKTRKGKKCHVPRCRRVKRMTRDALCCKCVATLSAIVARFEYAIQQLRLSSSKCCYGNAGRELLAARIVRVAAICECCRYIKRRIVYWVILARFVSIARE